MNNYELLYIIAGHLTEAEVETIKTKVDALLAKYQAVIGYQDTLGKRKLAYPINHHAYGYYLLTEFELPDPTVLQAISNDLRLDKEVVRAQVIAKIKSSPEAITKFKQRIKAEQKAASEGPVSHSRDERDRPKTDRKPVANKNLDQKLDEILKNENIV